MSPHDGEQGTAGSREFDVLLSSGFLAFARHLGFMQALEKASIQVTGICGTSSGAVVGVFWAAGIPLREMMERFPAKRPIQQLRFSRRPWHGLLTMEALLGEFKSRLPARLEGLPIPAGVGVTGPGKQHHILREGPLVEALMASCAVPGLLASQVVEGVRYGDGGITDRIGLDKWSAYRPGRRLLVHEVERSMGASRDGEPPEGVVWISSPRSHASLWNIGPFENQVAESMRLTSRVLSDTDSTPL